MNDLLPLEHREKELPRWVQILAGLILGLLTLLCGFASLSLWFAPSSKSPLLGVVAGLVLLLGCLWVLEKSFRLLTGRKNRGGLMAPGTLRVASYFLLVIPIAGLFTGYYRTMGLLAVFQALSYFSGSFALRALARNREAKESQVEHDSASDHEPPGKGLDETDT
jgi:hypothetical protein